MVTLSRDQIRTWKQLAHLTNLFRSTGSASAFIRRIALEQKEGSPDERIEGALDYLRNWASFHLPKALMALERIQKDVFERLNRPAGVYSPFAIKIENLMLPAALATLDEYGIPLQLVEKIKVRLRGEDGLDAVLDDLRNLDMENLGLSNFEKNLLKSLQPTF